MIHTSPPAMPCYATQHSGVGIVLRQGCRRKLHTSPPGNNSTGLHVYRRSWARAPATSVAVRSPHLPRWSRQRGFWRWSTQLQLVWWHSLDTPAARQLMRSTGKPYACCWGSGSDSASNVSGVGRGSGRGLVEGQALLDTAAAGVAALLDYTSCVAANDHI